MLYIVNQGEENVDDDEQDGRSLTSTMTNKGEITGKKEQKRKIHQM
jgi:hypothetical protein